MVTLNTWQICDASIGSATSLLVGRSVCNNFLKGLHFHEPISSLELTQVAALSLASNMQLMSYKLLSDRLLRPIVCRVQRWLPLDEGDRSGNDFGAVTFFPETIRCFIR